MTDIKLKPPKESPVSIKIMGLILSESYQYCKDFVGRLHKHYKSKFSAPIIKGFLEMDWTEYLRKLRKKIGDQTWAVKKGVVVFVEEVFIGGEEQLFERFKSYEFHKPSSDEIKLRAKRDYENYLNKNNYIYTYIEISMDGKYIGTLVFELRPDLLPKAATRFAFFCDRENRSGKSYKDSKVHRVCKSGWFQAGILPGDNMLLEDETFCYKHDRRGVVSFTNDGIRNSNGTQFFVIFKPAAWMDERYVAFGRVVEGSEVLTRIEYTDCFYESPQNEITISDCGLIPHGFGKRMITKFKIKGLTVGVPHIHLDMFMDILLDRFCEVLFNRLDAEVKREINSEWIGKMLWDRVSDKLALLNPIDNTLDVKDKSSELYLLTTYLAGLYGLRDIPDHEIKELLNNLIDEAVERSDVNKLAKEIIDMILDSWEMDEAIIKKMDSENSAEEIINYLLKRVNFIIFGPDISPSTSSRSESVLSKSLFSLASKESLSELEKRVGKETESSLSGMSLRESLAGFIWGMLLDALKGKFESELV